MCPYPQYVHKVSAILLSVITSLTWDTLQRSDMINYSSIYMDDMNPSTSHSPIFGRVVVDQNPNFYIFLLVNFIDLACWTHLPLFVPEIPMPHRFGYRAFGIQRPHIFHLHSHALVSRQIQESQTLRWTKTSTGFNWNMTKDWWIFGKICKI